MKFEVENIVENGDGTCSVEYDYDEEFEQFAREQLKLENGGKEPTKEELESFFAKEVQKMVDKQVEMEAGNALMEEIKTFGED